MTASDIGAGRDITGLGSSAAAESGRGTRATLVGARDGARDAGAAFVAVSFSGGPALAMGTTAESGNGPITRKLEALSVCAGSSGRSNETLSVTESIAETSRSRGGRVSWVNTRSSVRVLSVRLRDTLSHG